MHEYIFMYIWKKNVQFILENVNDVENYEELVTVIYKTYIEISEEWVPNREIS